MKKLNRKGFTLIELLAVVVILAIILVVTIPSVLSTMDDAREKQLQNAADTVAEWFTKQYELAELGSDLGTSGTDSAYNAFPVTATEQKFNAAGGEAALKAAGLSNASSNINLASSSVKLNGHKVCVKLTANTGGSFNNKRDNEKESSGCQN